MTDKPSQEPQAEGVPSGHDKADCGAQGPAPSESVESDVWASMSTPRRIFVGITGGALLIGFACMAIRVIEVPWAAAKKLAQE